MQLIVGSKSYNGSIILNLCGFRNPPLGCPINITSIGYFVSDDKTSCYPLSDSNATKWEYYALNVTNKSANGFTINGSNTTADTLAINTSLVFKCDDKVNGEPQFSHFQPNSTTFSVVITHKYGCGITHGGPLRFLDDYAWPLMPVALLLGGWMLLLGAKHIRFLAMLAAFFVGVVIGIGAASVAFKKESMANDIGLATAILLGGVLATVTFFFRVVSRSICAVVIGVVLGMQNYSLGLYRMESWDGLPVTTIYLRLSSGYLLQYALLLL